MRQIFLASPAAEKPVVPDNSVTAWVQKAPATLLDCQRYKCLSSQIRFDSVSGMEIQSLSICVPAGCPNRCRFCVSQMHDTTYPDVIEQETAGGSMPERDYLQRLEFARDNGCNTVILTGNGEPVINRRFLERFAMWNKRIAAPFRWVELQTSGVTVDDEMLEFLRDNVAISTISFSLSDMFDSDSNAEINGTPEKLRVDVEDLCRKIKERGFNLRLSLNMTVVYNDRTIESLFHQASRLGADQITFRQLYVSDDTSVPQNQWILANQYSRFDMLTEYIQRNGRILEVLPFGATRYSLQGMSTVLDSDCMSVTPGQVIKYLILRPDCHLYTKWDDKGSLLF